MGGGAGSEEEGPCPHGADDPAQRDLSRERGAECFFMTLGACPGLEGELSTENPLPVGPPRGLYERSPEEAHADPLSPQVHPAAASV